MDKMQKQQEIQHNFFQKIQELEIQQDNIQRRQQELTKLQDEFYDFRSEMQLLIENIRIQNGDSYANWLLPYEQELSDEYQKMEVEYNNKSELLEQERKRLYQLEDEYYREKEQQLMLLDKE